MLKKKNEKGQALFEFVIFVPFILIFIATIVTIVGAVNASINQVKATRGYFYAMLNNNSLGMRGSLLTNYIQNHNMQSVGSYSIGWREKKDGENAIAPCFRISTFIGETPANEVCEEKVTEEFSTYIKVKTMYGLCIGTFTPSSTGAGTELSWQTSALYGSSCSLID
jgi:hypothetical protein